MFMLRSLRLGSGVRTRSARAFAMSPAAQNGVAAKVQKTEADQDRADFLALFEELREEIVNDPLLKGQPEFSKDWVCKMINYNVPHGKLNRGLAVLDVIKCIHAARPPVDSAKDLRLAGILGWCVEFLQAYFLVADDIMDRSVTRRGQPCWYRRENVGMVAINDGILLESYIYRLLRSHFRSHPSYLGLMELFHDVTSQTAHGQLLDTTNTPVGRVDLARYTPEIYERIVTFKTSFYTFYLPVAAGLLLAGEQRTEALALAQDISLKMGAYFQAQDDVLDAYGDPETIGKIGTDIQDNKCSWLVVRALQKASEDQRAVLEKNYGRDEPEAVQAVKEVYAELELREAFDAYEADFHAQLTAAIDGQDYFPPRVFHTLLAKIYKREK